MGACSGAAHAALPQSGRRVAAGSVLAIGVSLQAAENKVRMAEMMYFLVLRLSHVESGSHIWTRCTTGDCGKVIHALSTVSRVSRRRCHQGVWLVAACSSMRANGHGKVEGGSTANRCRYCQVSKRDPLFSWSLLLAPERAGH